MMRGDIDMLRLAIWPPCQGKLPNTDFALLRLGHVDPNSLPGVDLKNSLHSAKTLEVFEFVEGFFNEPQREYSALLAHYAELGNIAIVRYLLEKGALVDGGIRSDQNPLTIACRNCHKEIVDLLLERGADPGCYLAQVLGCPLHAATSGGSLSIMPKLLAHVASFADVNWEPILNALRLEHTAMVEFILNLRDWGEKELRGIAR
ncbi:hypothetical protein ONS96_013509 [Cadophora gregata f. sp. sojae]|nr:hypothetical protein ONS96_013509 [Cadophora gregata f. sp. sojae]